MIRIRLKNKNKYAIVDDEFKALVSRDWHVHSTGYAICRETVYQLGGREHTAAELADLGEQPKGLPKRRRAEYLHRVVANLTSSRRVRFVNGNPLDCRSSNIRVLD